jgi:predicted RNase H-like nuclease
MDDPDVLENQEIMKKRRKIEKERHYRRIEINRMKAKKTEDFQKEISDYKKGREEFETMKRKAMTEIMEKENINKYEASKRFKEEYDKHLEYTRIIQEISKEHECSKEEAENIFKQVVTQMRANPDPVPE